MKFLSLALLAAVFVSPIQTQQQKGQGQAMPNDQLIFAEQFMRLFFPQIAGRENADIYFRASMPASEPTASIGYSKPHADRISVAVIDWCTPPRDPMSKLIGGVGRWGMPCDQYDKQYKTPLSGEIGFVNWKGRIIPANSFFHGTLLDDPTPCGNGKPATRKELIAKLHLNQLSLLLGRKVQRVEIIQDNGAALLQVGPVGSRHSRYVFYLDHCGYITSFELQN